MRLTRAGWGLLGTAVACGAVGRLFGTVELYLLAATALACLLVAVVFVGFTRLELTVRRTAAPTRLRVGSPARIELALTNLARLPTPPLRLEDRLGEERSAIVHVAPVRHGATCVVAYHLPTRSRGRLRVGPLHLVVGDPLGLVTSRIDATGGVDLVVHAPLDDLGALHARAGNDPSAEQQTSRALAAGGDEFFALRPYVVGDELRRVHWPTSARLGELVVKQEERARTGRVTVLFDVRREAYTEAGFERAVSAALSVLTAGWRGDDSLRYATSASSVFTDLRSRAELDAIDEQLALITPTGSASVVRTLDQLGRISRGGTLVVVTGVPSEQLDSAIEMAGRRFNAVTVVYCEPHGHSTSRQASPGGATVVSVDGHHPLPEVWGRR